MRNKTRSNFVSLRKNPKVKFHTNVYNELFKIPDSDLYRKLK